MSYRRVGWIFGFILAVAFLDGVVHGYQTSGTVDHALTDGFIDVLWAFGVLAGLAIFIMAMFRWRS